jgi:hypothetical protein
MQWYSLVLCCERQRGWCLLGSWNFERGSALYIRLFRLRFSWKFSRVRHVPSGTCHVCISGGVTMPFLTRLLSAYADTTRWNLPISRGGAFSVPGVHDAESQYCCCAFRGIRPYACLCDREADKWPLLWSEKWLLKRKWLWCLHCLTIDSEAVGSVKRSLWPTFLVLRREVFCICGWEKLHVEMQYSPFKWRSIIHCQKWLCNVTCQY